MKKIQTILLILIVYSFLLLPFPNHTTAQDKMEEKTTPNANKFALLVGVNIYQNKDVKADEKRVQRLFGTHNDVALMKSLLIEKGFKEDVVKPGDDNSCGKQSPTSNVKTLCSAEATKKAILDAIDSQLIAKAAEYAKKNNVDPQNGAYIVFYYSGHGSFLNDQKTKEEGKDESDGFDETILPTDAKWDGTNQIRDDEINSRINKLKEYTTNITFVFDNCNSGTISRGPGAKRFISQTTSPNANNTGSQSRGNVQDSYDAGEGYVTISGSLPTELSYEDEFPSSDNSGQYQRNGVLTYYFVQFAREFPTATYKDVLSLVKTFASIQTRSREPQTPQAEGEVDRPIFGSTTGKKYYLNPKCETDGEEQTCSIIEKRKDGDKETSIHKITVPAGQLIGAREGGLIAIYDPDTDDFSDENKKIGDGTITSATQFVSSADVTMTENFNKNSKYAGKFPPLARIIVVSPNFTDAKRKVAIDVSPSSTSKGNETEDIGGKVLTGLEEKLKKNTYIETVKSLNLMSYFNQLTNTSSIKEVNWDLAVVRSSFKEFKTKNPANADLAISRSNRRDEKDSATENTEVIYITNSRGIPLYNFAVRSDNRFAAIKIQNLLESHVRLENLRSLGNETSSVGSKVKIEFVRVQKYRVLEMGKTATGGSIPTKCSTEVYKDEQTIEKDKAASTPTVAFSKMIMEGTDRGVEGDSYYFNITNNSDEDLYVYAYNLTTSAEIIRVYPSVDGEGDKIAPKQTVSTAGNNNCRVFFHTANGSNVGKETVKFIVTTDPFPSELLTQPTFGYKRGKGKGSALASLINRASTNEAVSRGETWGSDGKLSDWGTLTFDIQVIP